MNLLQAFLETLPAEEVAHRQEVVLLIALTILIAGAITCILAHESARTRYRIAAGRRRPETLPAVKSPCTCGTCDDCAPGHHVPETYGYGLTGLPYWMPDAGEPTGCFALPHWLAPGLCRGCEVVQHEGGFLCQTCEIAAGRQRVHRVYRLVEQGNETQAWPLAEALVRDVRAFRDRSKCN